MTTFKHQNFTKAIKIKKKSETATGDIYYDLEFWRGSMSEPSLVIHTDHKTLDLLKEALKELWRIK